ncbi:hypothetical protein ACFPZL_01990 [Leucobacter soli]|uniref:Uncharacterized protein n=1 Tax=Leucobacter soli TaxID=2812850 RepID=A0A916JXN6_9MICO|nr:hypothetical protein [Leucobacter soli]CAG7611999.1 hypothetical protein LEUCIP111803_01513 [Leucobacter soli]
MSDDWVADVEIVTLAPKPGARDELLRIRPQILAEYDAFCGGRYDATLTENEDGGWVDVWRWVDRADAEAALDDIPGIIPTFARWAELVDLESLVWVKRIG